jgi:transposase
MIDDVMNRLKVKRGSQLPHAKLDEARVAEILEYIERREALKKELAGMTNGCIAKHYGVHPQTIYRLSCGETWGHVV